MANQIGGDRNGSVQNELVSDLMNLLEEDVLSASDLSHVCLFVAAFIALKRGQPRESLLSNLRDRYLHLENMLNNVVTDDDGEPYYVVNNPIEE